MLQDLFQAFLPPSLCFQDVLWSSYLWYSDSLELGLVLELLVKYNGHLGLQELNACNEV